jgi:hypothetical protein
MTRQEQEEQWVFETFARIFPGGPITIFKRQESPDFIIEFEGKTIGVELTEIFQDSSTGHSKLQQKSSDRENFTEELIQTIQPFVNFHFGVGIHFSEFSHIRKSDKQTLIQLLVQICLPRLSGIQNHEHLELDFYNGLPQQIDSISFSRLDESDCSFNFKPEGGTVAILTSEHVLPTLIKKEKKLKSYIGCQEYWLVIREGNYYAGSFSESDPVISIKTSFDKVFLLRTKKSQLITLK